MKKQLSPSQTRYGLVTLGWVLAATTLVVGVLPGLLPGPDRTTVLLSLGVLSLIWQAASSAKQAHLHERRIELLLAERAAIAEALAHEIEERLCEMGRRSGVIHGGKNVFCSVSDLEVLTAKIWDLQRQARWVSGPEPEEDHRRFGVRKSADWAQRAFLTQRQRAAHNGFASDVEMKMAVDAQNELHTVWGGLSEAGFLQGSNPIPYL